MNKYLHNTSKMLLYTYLHPDNSHNIPLAQESAVHLESSPFT
jgi:hypothetical protein